MSHLDFSGLTEVAKATVLRSTATTPPATTTKALGKGLEPDNPRKRTVANHIKPLRS